MKIIKFLKLSMDSIMRNKSRNFLTIIGIVIGISSVILIMSIGEGFKQSTLKEFKSNSDTTEVEFQSNSNNEDVRQNVFTDTDKQLINQIPGVKKVRLTAIDDSIEATISQRKKKKDTFISLFNKTNKITNKDLQKGKKITIINIKNGENVVYISNSIFNFLVENGGYDGTVDINGIIFHVIGILKPDTKIFSGDLFMPNKTYVENFGEIPGRDTMKIQIKDSWNKKLVQKNVIKRLSNFGSQKAIGKYKLVNNKVIGKSVGKIIDYLTYFIIAVASLSLFIAGVGVMNTMYMTVSERAQEIGIRRAFGANKRDIRVQFLIESALLCLLGGLVGVITGFASEWICSLILPFKPILSLKFIILALAISTSVGLIFGYIPANKAAKNNLIKIL